jgi:hypothetical protein
VRQVDEVLRLCRLTGTRVGHHAANSARARARRADAGNERTTRLFNVHYRAASLTESAKRR